MLTIFFVIDGQHRAAQAALLAATLYHHNADQFRYIGYVPHDQNAIITPSLLHLLDACGVELRTLRPHATVWTKKPYPHGNKILASMDRRNGTHAMFIDTDMICTAPLSLSHLKAQFAVGVVPEGKPTWGKDLSRWLRVYNHFSLNLPDDRITLTRGKRLPFVPYFNAGMILFPEGPLARNESFGDLWLDTSLIIDHEVPVAEKRPWLDQISLPVTLKRFGLDYLIAEEALNFSISQRTPTGNETPMLLHYHRFSFLGLWPTFLADAIRLTQAIAGDACFDKLAESFGPYWFEQPSQEHSA